MRRFACAANDHDADGKRKGYRQVEWLCCRVVFVVNFVVGIWDLVDLEIPSSNWRLKENSQSSLF